MTQRAEILSRTSRLFWAMILQRSYCIEVQLRSDTLFACLEAYGPALWVIGTSRGSHPDVLAGQRLERLPSRLLGRPTARRAGYPTASTLGITLY